MMQITPNWVVTFKNEDNSFVELAMHPNDVEAAVRILKYSGVKAFTVQEQDFVSLVSVSAANE